MPYESLDAETRCFALVGEFMCRWAIMETTMNEVIADALELKGMTGYIVTKNMQFRDKIKTLQATVTTAYMDQPLRDKYQKEIIQISDYGFTRNMFAHDPFGPDGTGDGVLFLKFVAHSKVKFDDVRWSISDFVAAFEKIEKFSSDLKAIGGKLRSTNSMRRIAELLIAQENRPPTSGTDWTTLLNLPSAPAQDALHSPSTTDTKDAQTPEEPQA